MSFDFSSLRGYYYETRLRAATWGKR